MNTKKMVRVAHRFFLKIKKIKLDATLHDANFKGGKVWHAAFDLFVITVLKYI